MGKPSKQILSRKTSTYSTRECSTVSPTHTAEMAILRKLREMRPCVVRHPRSPMLGRNCKIFSYQCWKLDILNTICCIRWGPMTQWCCSRDIATPHYYSYLIRLHHTLWAASREAPSLHDADWQAAVHALSMSRRCQYVDGRASIPWLSSRPMAKLCFELTLRSGFTAHVWRTAFRRRTRREDIRPWYRAVLLSPWARPRIDERSLCAAYPLRQHDHA